MRIATIICRKVSQEEKEELDLAWYDYCITNRLIAYGEVNVITPAVEEAVEKRCKDLYEKEIKRIRRKYALSYSESGELPER